MDFGARKLELELLEGRFAICRIDGCGPVPAWAMESMISLMRTPDELTVVCPESSVAPGVAHDPGWKLLKIAGILPFSETGILASLLQPLAEAGISIFALSSYSTDFVLIKADSLQGALRALEDAGHRIGSGGSST